VHIPLTVEVDENQDEIYNTTQLEKEQLPLMP